MRRFKKKPELTYVLIPGFGMVKGDMLLTGDQYAKFCPALLVEVLEVAHAPVPASEPVATDAEVVAAVRAHEQTVSAPLVPEYVPPMVAPVATIDTPTPVEAPAPAPVPVEVPVSKAVKPSAPAPKPTGKKPTGKK